AEQVARKQRRLVPAGSRPHLDDDVAIVPRIFRDELLLDLAREAGLPLEQRRLFGCGEVTHFRIPLARKRLRVLDLLRDLAVLLVGGHDSGQAGVLAGALLVPALIAENRRVRERASQLLVTRLERRKLVHYFCAHTCLLAIFVPYRIITSELGAPDAQAGRPGRPTGSMKPDGPARFLEPPGPLDLDPVLLGELLAPPLGVDELSLTGVERMALGADLDADVLPGGSCQER